MSENIILETLKLVLSKMLGKNIIHADYKTKRLTGGGGGEVKLVAGIAEADSGEKLPYKVIYKTAKKDDNDSREYKLYISGGSDYHGVKSKPEIELGTGCKNNIQIEFTAIESWYHKVMKKLAVPISGT